MTALRYSFAAVALLSCAVIHCKAQIISDWETGSAKGIVSSMDVDTDENQGPIQGWESADTLFQGWGTVLGEFGEYLTITQEQLEQEIDTKGKDVRTLILNGKMLNLPSSIDENGIDLYMLTEEGATIYMAMLAPAYYQDTNPEILKWIRYYAYEKRKRTETLFSRYSRWEAYIKKRFAVHDVPEEIAELCMIESGCTTAALSPAGARGMWQIMPKTGRQWGLEIDDNTDDRLDPIKSIETAARIFHSSYNTLGDWTLAVASYNCGTGRIIKTCKQARSREWTELEKYLPDETRHYIPALLAIHYVWTYRDKLGF